MTRIKDILIGLLFILLQITLANLVTIKGIKPDLVVLYVISRAIIGGPAAGIAWGFGLGLLLDSLSGNLTGLGALSYSLAGFIAGLIGPGKILTRFRYLAVVAFGVFTAHLILLYFTQPWHLDGFMAPFLTFTLPGTVYSFFLAFIWVHSPFMHLQGGKERV